MDRLDWQEINDRNADQCQLSEPNYGSDGPQKSDSKQRQPLHHTTPHIEMASEDPPTVGWRLLCADYSSQSIVVNTNLHDRQCNRSGTKGALHVKEGNILSFPFF